jgi:hypothetical protein
MTSRTARSPLCSFGVMRSSSPAGQLILGDRRVGLPRLSVRSERRARRRVVERSGAYSADLFERGRLMSKSSPAVKRTATWPRNEARSMPGAGSIGNRSAQFPGGTTGQQGERLTRRERKFDMTSSSNTKADVEILTDLNANYLRSDQAATSNGTLSISLTISRRLCLTSNSVTRRIPGDDGAGARIYQADGP